MTGLEIGYMMSVSRKHVLFSSVIACPGFSLPLFVANVTYSNDPSFIEPTGISRYPYDTKAIQTCQDGYRIVAGDKVRVCSYGDREWTGESAVCEGEFLNETLI